MDQRLPANHLLRSPLTPSECLDWLQTFEPDASADRLAELAVWWTEDKIRMAISLGFD